MPSYVVDTPQRKYEAVVERGILSKLADYVPPGAGRLFILTTEDVWKHHCTRLANGLIRYSHEVMIFPGGEERKRLSSVESLADEMVRRGADRSSIVIGFGGGIVTDIGGFLAAIFMRGIPALQIPTTLLAQVDAAIGGKTGVNLEEGKNLIGAFHQPRAVLIDPDVLSTLPDREYRAGLFEILKCGVIRSPRLFSTLIERKEEVLAREPDTLVDIISESVRIKAEVVSADEREGDLRRILNFGHTVGHALEAETGYSRFLHGEAVAFGMRAAVHIAMKTGRLQPREALQILEGIEMYGPIPSLEGVGAAELTARLKSDKKTLQGKVHFVLPESIGQIAIVSGIDESLVRSAVQDALR